MRTFATATRKWTAACQFTQRIPSRLDDFLYHVLQISPEGIPLCYGRNFIVQPRFEIRNGTNGDSNSYRTVTGSYRIYLYFNKYSKLRESFIQLVSVRWSFRWSTREPLSGVNLLIIGSSCGNSDQKGHGQ
jgi:hypothetical protein